MLPPEALRAAHVPLARTPEAAPHALQNLLRVVRGVLDDKALVEAAQALGCRLGRDGWKQVRAPQIAV